ncbi:MAG: hypothetical protein ACYS8X_02210 [Planctomycetota bacterium]|jgi:hypothetical protein
MFMHTQIHSRPFGRNKAVVWVVAAMTLAGVGCDKVDLNTYYTSVERMDHGLVVILPGIEGESAANRDIRKGLDDAGMPHALAIYRWGHPVPGIGMLFNQTDAAGNRRAGQELAERIVTYQTNYPGRPVFLIGHSGGGGVAVFTLESLAGLPNAQPLEGAFLLSASISSNYPLHGALRMTRRGMVNVYNPEDGFLRSGTALFGNVDGGKGDAAGQAGFTGQYSNLYQRQITTAISGVPGDPHFIATNASLITARAPAWLMSTTWPPAGASR